MKKINVAPISTGPTINEFQSSHDKRRVSINLQNGLAWSSATIDRGTGDFLNKILAPTDEQREGY